MIAGPALVSEEEEKEKNGRKCEATKVIGTFSQLRVSLRRILSSCPNSFYIAGFAGCEVATPRFFSSKAAS